MSSTRLTDSAPFSRQNFEEPVWTLIPNPFIAKLTHDYTCSNDRCYVLIVSLESEHIRGVSEENASDRSLDRARRGSLECPLLHPFNRMPSTGRAPGG